MVNLSSDSDRFRALFSRMDGSILQARDGHVRLAAGGLHIIAFFLPFFCSFFFFFFCHRLVLWLSLLVVVNYCSILPCFIDRTFVGEFGDFRSRVNGLLVARF